MYAIAEKTLNSAAEAAFSSGKSASKSTRYNSVVITVETVIALNVFRRKTTILTDTRLLRVSSRRSIEA